MAVTVYQIAEACGLSQPTVSQILGGKGERYSAKTRRLVEETAERMRYRPNTMARAVRMGGLSSVALIGIMGQTHDLPSQGILTGVYDTLSQKELLLSFGRLTAEHLAAPEVTKRMLRDWHANGFLMNTNGSSTASDQVTLVADIVQHYRLPAIWLNSDGPIDAIYPDHGGASRMAVDHLVEAGHRRIAYVTMISGNKWEIAHRSGAYTRAMEGHGLEPMLNSLVFHTISKQKRKDKLFEETSKLLSQKSRPTAMITHESEARRLHYVVESLGFRVPQDLSLITYESVDAVTDSGKRISGVHISNNKLGNLAADMLLEKMEKPEEALPPKAVPYYLVEGETVASPASE